MYFHGNGPSREIVPAANSSPRRVNNVIILGKGNFLKLTGG